MYITLTTIPLNSLYFFFHGLHFREALADFSAVSGPMALMDVQSYGVWHSWYHSYSDAEYRATVETYANLSLPLHVAVLDMEQVQYYDLIIARYQPPQPSHPILTNPIALPSHSWHTENEGNDPGCDVCTIDQTRKCPPPPTDPSPTRHQSRPSHP